MTPIAYLLYYAFCFAIGTILGMLIDKDNTYKVTIRKIKQRGRGNVLDSDLSVEMPLKTKKEQRKQNRLDKKANK